MENVIIASNHILKVLTEEEVHILVYNSIQAYNNGEHCDHLIYSTLGSKALQNIVKQY